MVCHYAHILHIGRSFPQLFVGMILILIFAEVLGLYGLIVALILNTKGSSIVCHAVAINPCCGPSMVWKVATVNPAVDAGCFGV